jgi:hypothetical protein
MARSRKLRNNPSVPKPVDAAAPAGWIAGISWRPHAWRILALWALVLLAYSNSFRAGLVYDSATIILQDSRIRTATAQNLNLILDAEYWYNFSTTGLYRPLTTFSYLVNYAVLGNGPHPVGYHWVNFALHAFNMLLVYLLGMVIFQESALALAMAAVWALHPLLTESVTNVVGRADLLAAFGVLAGLLCYVAGASARGWHRAAWRSGLMVAAAIGIFSKENAAILPGLMVVYDAAWTGREKWRERAPDYLAVALPFAFYFYLRVRMQSHFPLGLVAFADNPLVDANFWTARLTAIKVIGKYFWLFFWPSRLSPDYSFNAVPVAGWQPVNWENAQAVIALVLCLASAALALRCYRRQKPIFFFILFFFVALSPTSNLVILSGSIMAERFLYLPSIGLAGFLVGVWHAFGWSRQSRLAWTVLGLVCASCAARTYARNLDWFDERSLWRSAAKASPGSFKTHWEFAISLAGGAGFDLDRSVDEADRALAILAKTPLNEQTPAPYADAAFCYRTKGDSLNEADRAYWYQKALATLLRGEEVDAAVSEFVRQANLGRGKTALVRSWTPLYLELGRIYLRLSQPDKALEALAFGRARRPDAEFSLEMARAWLAKEDWQQAAVALMEGMVLDPNSTVLAADLMEIYHRQAPQSCAVAGSARIDLNCPLVHDQLCQASRNVALTYRQNGQPRQAGITVRTAIQSLGCPAERFQ